MIDPVLLSEIRDFLQDISTGAPVTDASRDHATEFVACLAGQPQSPGLSREAVLSAVIAAGNCGIGDTGPDGKWRAIACNDESLKGDRHYFREDCDCSKITDAVLTLVQGPDTRPLRTTGE